MVGFAPNRAGSTRGGSSVGSKRATMCPSGLRRLAICFESEIGTSILNHYATFPKTGYLMGPSKIAPMLIIFDTVIGKS